MEAQKLELDYSDIAPYSDEEVPAAIRALLHELSFIQVLRFVYPEMDDDAIYAHCVGISSVREFQAKVAYPAMKLMNEKTISTLSHTGFDTLPSDEGVLYISNHRDIILDSALLNMLLHEHAMDTTETAIGSNLLKNPTVRHLTKLNRNFTVNRDVQRSQLFETSSKLSSYIRQGITKRNTSIWISQREGRAKNGDDRTQQGLLKMLAMSGSKDVKSSFAELNVRPLALSYEFDPCDYYKVRELLALSKGEPYTKEQDEDLANIVAGISQPKGRVHVAITPPLLPYLERINEEVPRNDQVMQVAQLIDRLIHAETKLWPVNYLAADLIAQTNLYTQKYQSSDRAQFEEYLEPILEKIDMADHDTAREILLQKYAYPVINRLMLVDSE